MTNYDELLKIKRELKGCDLRPSQIPCYWYGRRGSWRWLGLSFLGSS